MALAALIVSVVSALASALAVGVSVWTHKQQGSLIECRCSSAIPVSGDNLGEHCVQVEAVNMGRSAATISGWGFALLDERHRPTGETIVLTEPPRWLPALPHRLDGESSAAWMMPVEQLRGTLAGREGGSREVKAFVRTGTGRQVLAASPVRLGGR